MTQHLPLYLSREGKELRRLFEMAYPACLEILDAENNFQDPGNDLEPGDVCRMAYHHALTAHRWLIERGLLAPDEDKQ